LLLAFVNGERSALADFGYGMPTLSRSLTQLESIANPEIRTLMLQFLEILGSRTVISAQHQTI
jgi:hypothetical protein